MRLVSQNGRLSFSMEQIVLTVLDSQPCEVYAYYNAELYSIGKYDSERKALLEMAEIHNKYAEFKRNEMVLKGMADLLANYTSEDKLMKYLDLTKESVVYQLRDDIDIKKELENKE